MKLKLQEKEVLLYLFKNNYSNQRSISQSTSYSLGAVNCALQNLQKLSLVDAEKRVTLLGRNYIALNSPKRAVILAAGLGMRIIPINMEYPKGLLQIKGEILIERLIRQLHDAQVYDIDVVVGFMKQKFEYLIDYLGVNLIVFNEYRYKNNLNSLSKVKVPLSNTYILPADIWVEDNPFSKFESHSWYLAIDRKKNPSLCDIYINKERTISTNNKRNNFSMGEISYIDNSDGQRLTEIVKSMAKDKRFDNDFWESALVDHSNGHFYIPAKIRKEDGIYGINTYEELRAADSNSLNLKTDITNIICNVFKVPIGDIANIQVIKSGMTNRSFLFSVNDEKYMMRIPGEGTSTLVNRANECDNYVAIKNYQLSDSVCYINPINGYKITKFVEKSRVCDPKSVKDLRLCMGLLRHFHNLNLKVGHVFDIYKLIDYYESLWNEKASCYVDYNITKENVLSLKPFIETHIERVVLSHNDPNADNFLIFKDQDGTEQVRLIDWEYGGMHDPDSDVAMFGIYSLLDREEIDRLIDIYYENACSKEIRVKIYCYIAASGLLWSNWCEYKADFGVEFGEYSLRQYRYAKDFYRIAKREMEGLTNV